MTARAAHSPQSGFTLLEALVVLVIAGLVGAVLIQGLGTVLAVRTSVGRNVLDLRSVVMERSIIADPIQGILPDYKDNPYVFQGKRQVLSGLTIRPINGPFGVPRPFSMTFNYDRARDETVLIYAEDDGPSYALSRWSGDRGMFAYRDIEGDWRPDWPPPFDDTAPQTPWLVRIDSGLEANPSIIAFIASPHERRYRIEDVGFTNSAGALLQ